ncbi:MAG: EAL domain-containing protein [Massilia sp.]|nr:EAL domain-containing protein [Massilia sp.]
MTLSDYIASNIEAIVLEWDAYAATLERLSDAPDRSVLRDHAQQLLETIAAQLAAARAQAGTVNAGAMPEQLPSAQSPSAGVPSAGASLGVSNTGCALSLKASVCAFRALHACVTRRWTLVLAVQPITHADIDDLVRFHAAIDQAMSASVASYTRETEQHTRIFDAAPDALIVVNADGKITLANRQAEKAFGYARRELLGASIELLVPERLRASHVQRRQHYQQAPHQRPMGAGLALFGRRKDGSEFPLDILLSPIHSAAGVQVLTAVRDVTERNAVLADLYEARERSRVTLESIGDAVLSADTAGQILYLNESAQQMTGWSCQDARGQTLRHVLNIVEQDQRDTVQLLTRELALSERSSERVTRHSILIRRDDSEIPIEYSVAPIHDASGKTIGIVIVFRDISKTRELTRQMAYLAQHDFLTNLPNRMLLIDRLTQAIVLAGRGAVHLAVLFLDLDHFKHINDSLGHGVGDLLLQSVAQRLVASVRGSDTVSRIGGDEFVILLPTVGQAADAAKSADKIIAALAETHHIAGHDLQVSPSIGISVYPADGEDAETLIKNADLAMYHAKDSGRNNAQFFTPDMNLRSVERQTVESGLRLALDRGEFELYYQPKVDLRSGVTVGAEALIRWHHPQRGLMLPAQFIPIAEDCGLVVPIGRWAMAEACRQMSMWHAEGAPPVPVSVNISALEFRSRHFLDDVQAILAQTHIAPRYLELELTESMLMQHADAAICVLDELKRIGVRLTIDDFGTGYSSLSYLSHFPIDVLKIDQSFLHEITTHSYNATIVSAVIGMCEGLRCDVIAEGVESAEQAAFLLAHHCSQIQGFYCGRPLPAEDFAQQRKHPVAVAPRLPASRALQDRRRQQRRGPESPATH